MKRTDPTPHALIPYPDFKRRLSLLLFPSQPEASDTDLLARVGLLLAREQCLNHALTNLAEAVFHAEHYHDAPQDVRNALAAAQTVLEL